MAGRTSVALLRDIQTLFDAGTAVGLSDRELLERFAARRDAAAEAAFEVLVLRHGPMVWRVCRNVLLDTNDAHDAFQATFLVLVRRRGSVRKLESLGGWLYGVANRVAARARVDAARRRAVEGRAALRVVEAFEPENAEGTEHQEFGPIVREEVRRLPEKYRAAMVLCYWEGLTQEQASVQLGIPLGTVRSRVARARDLLRRRLTRRGLAPLAGAWAVGVDGTLASVLRLGAVPVDLVRATIRAAVQVGTREATSRVLSAGVAPLVQQVLWSMTMIKISGIVAGVFLMGLAGYGVRVAGQPARPAQSEIGQAVADPTSPQGRLAEAQPARTKKSARGKGRRKTAPFEGIYSNIEGQTTIITILPNGSVVKKGDVLCELDAAALRDRLINQRITRESAKANYQNAKLAREEAESEASWFQNELYPREKREVEAEVNLAESEVAVGEAEQIQVKSIGGNNELALKRADLAIARARLALEKAKNRLHILTRYTRDHRNRELATEVGKSKSNELSREATWELEKNKEAKLERQIAACTITAPIDGTVVHADFRIEVGASVRERQLILRIVPPPADAPDPR